MTHAESLSTLTPSAPDIYPQLSTVSEDVNYASRCECIFCLKNDMVGMTYI